MSSTYQPCPICKSPTRYQGQSNDPDLTEVVCFRCGLYRYTFEADLEYFQEGLNDAERAKLSSWIYHNQKADILSDIIEDILKLPTPSVHERAEGLLHYLSKTYPSIGQRLDNLNARLAGSLDRVRKNEFSESANDEAKILLPMLSTSYSPDRPEFGYLLQDYLCDELGYLSNIDNPTRFVISPRGWAFLHEQEHSNKDSTQGFVAMRFSDKRKLIFKIGIKPGIEQAGFDPRIMNEYDHNRRIDDEIMVQIRKSRFVVADLTYQNNGVYFEAGYAKGLGIPVIWICRKGTKVHFDNRQYNTIRYTDEEIEKLVSKLKNRILNTVGDPN